ncbi:MAG: hypothetical protein AAF628_06260 [Planctomycetota bacterium]
MTGTSPAAAQLPPWAKKLALLAVAWSILHAILLAWVSDDAFITYRYSQNFADGLGLVYNAGERVEGYTNFSWAVLLGLGIKVGIDPILLSHVLGIACHLGTLLVLLRGGPGGLAVFPLAATGYALHHFAAEFATSGLETSLFTLLLTAAVVRLVLASRAWHYAAAGVLLVALCTTRPDGMLCYGLAGLLTIAHARQSRDPRPLIALALPAILLYAPFFVWKWTYYGYPFPNTFYAKSAHDPYFSSGLRYVGFYLSYCFVLVPALATPLLLFGTGTRRAVTEAGWATRGPLVVGGLVVVWLLYVAWVGGDFMFSRFCIPVTPALYLGLQLLTRRVRWSPVRAAAVVLVAAGSTVTSFTQDRIADSGWSHERRVYPPWRLAAFDTIGAGLDRILGDTNAFAIVGSMQAQLGYFAAFPRAIEINGLTDEHLAHRPIEQRGWVGHEKGMVWHDDYFVERGVHFVFGLYDFMRAPPEDRIGQHRCVSFFVAGVPLNELSPALTEPVDMWVRGTMITYDRALMQSLRGREDVEFLPFEDHLDDYLATIDERDADEVALDYAAYRRFYFDHNEDRERQRAFEAFLERAQ